MKSLSIGQAAQEAGQFLKRESGLLVPVTLLFIAIPLAMLLLSLPPSLRQAVASETVPQSTEMPVASLVMLMVCAVLATTGSLALYTLALRPGVSVGEALRHGARRMPVALGAALIMGFILLLLLSVLSGVSVQLGAAALTIGALLISAKMLLLNAVVASRRVGVIAAIRESWSLSRGHMLRLLAFIGLMSLPILVVQAVGQMLFGIIGYAVGGAAVGQQAGDVGAAFAMALGNMVMIVVTASIYRQITGNAR